MIVPVFSKISPHFCKVIRNNSVVGSIFVIIANDRHVKHVP